MIKDLNWYENLIYHNRFKKLLVILPPQQKILLNQKSSLPLRNLAFMKGVFTKYPTFIWVSQLSLSRTDIIDSYNIGIEFLHARTVFQVYDLLNSQFVDDVILVTNCRSIEEVYLQLKRQIGREKQIKNIYVYVPNKDEKNSLPYQYRKMKIERLNELYCEIQHLEIKKFRKQNPKFLAVIPDNLQRLQNIANIFKWILQNQFDRVEGKKNFIQLWEKFFNQKKRNFSELLNAFDYPTSVNFDEISDIKSVTRQYVDESNAYKILNIILRASQDIFSLGYVAFFAQDLCKAIHILAQKQQGKIEGEYYSGKSLFRRTHLEEHQKRLLKKQKNICLQGFISTSLCQEVLKNFIGNTIIEIKTQKNDYKMGYFCFLQIKSNEQQIIFTPYCWFQIIDIIAYKSKQRVEINDQNGQQFYENIQIEMLRVVLKFKGHLNNFLKKEKQKNEDSKLSEKEIKIKWQKKLEKLVNAINTPVKKIIKKTIDEILQLTKQVCFARLLARDEDWSQFYRSQEQYRYKILLPPKEVIAKTMKLPGFFQDDYIFKRSLDYIYHDRLCILWLGQIQPEAQFIKKIYEIGVDFYWLKHASQLENFILYLSERAIFIGIERQNFQQVFQLYLRSQNVMKIFVFQQQQGIKEKQFIFNQQDYPQVQKFNKFEDILAFLQQFTNYQTLKYSQFLKIYGQEGQSSGKKIKILQKILGQNYYASKFEESNSFFAFLKIFEGDQGGVNRKFDKKKNKIARKHLEGNEQSIELLNQAQNIQISTRRYNKQVIFSEQYYPHISWMLKKTFKFNQVDLTRQNKFYLFETNDQDWVKNFLKQNIGTILTFKGPQIAAISSKSDISFCRKTEIIFSPMQKFDKEYGNPFCMLENGNKAILNPLNLYRLKQFKQVYENDEIEKQNEETRSGYKNIQVMIKLEFITNQGSIKMIESKKNLDFNCGQDIITRRMRKLFYFCSEYSNDDKNFKIHEGMKNIPLSCAQLGGCFSVLLKNMDKLRNIQQLNLYYQNIKMRHIKELQKINIPLLKKLNLTYNKITDLGCQYLSHCCFNQLRQLRISDIFANKKGYQLLHHSFPKLQTYWVGEQNFDVSGNLIDCLIRISSQVYYLNLKQERYVKEEDSTQILPKKIDAIFKQKRKKLMQQHHQQIQAKNRTVNDYLFKQF